MVDRPIKHLRTRSTTGENILKLGNDGLLIPNVLTMADSVSSALSGIYAPDFLICHGDKTSPGRPGTGGITDLLSPFQ